ncbi:hypothetical protein C8F04DRAFT_1279619 [Mycena alexandri]|uniref:Uncharacterized protein n=1 Tax=Mycena alexandri TaxID=1745969 RepID=A0AAD6RXS8_9AGAR|nr:hypothetical protein C8F04DRAFT_1279619 [Mycena alexandri]
MIGNKTTLAFSSSVIDWPTIDYEHVPTETCEAVLGSLNKQAAPTVPETPHRIRIAREINFVLSKRDFLGNQRVVRAQAIGASLKHHVPVILRFLEAARRTANEQFVFPDREITVLDSLRAVRDAVEVTEDMLRQSMDLDGTDGDTDAEDADETRVAEED